MKLRKEVKLPNSEFRDTKNKSYKDDGYKEQLEHKVKTQAERLYDLQKYKELCERRIRQLAPNHPLPVSDSHIRNYEDVTKSYSSDIQSNNLTHSLSLQIKDLNKQLNRKDEVAIY
jgi:hypothetical protein